MLKARDLTRHVLKRRARETTRTESIEPSYQPYTPKKDFEALLGLPHLEGRLSEHTCNLRARSVLSASLVFG